jgi:hypothetical protein
MVEGQKENAPVCSGPEMVGLVELVQRREQAVSLLAKDIARIQRESELCKNQQRKVVETISM